MEKKELMYEIGKIIKNIGANPNDETRPALVVLCALM